MLRLTLAQMRRSLPRLVAAGLAILLGSAFVTATLTAGDAITRGGYDAVTASYGSADLVVRPTEDDSVGNVLDVARSTAGVTAADPLLLGWTTLSSGRRTVTQTIIPAPTNDSLGSLEVVAGAAPASPTELALPRSSAERLGVGVGDTLTVTWWDWSEVDEVVEETPAADAATASPQAEPTVVDPAERTQEVTLVGLVDDPYGAWAEYGGAGLAALDDLLTWGGYGPLEAESSGAVLVDVAGDATVVQATLRELLPASDVLTRDEAAIQSVEEYGAGNVIVMLALGFAAVALLVAALVIANTFQVLVAQRTRMLALLRCVGARRNQLRGSVLLEAALLGTAAGVGGVLVGLGLAQGALSVLSRTQDGVPLPTTVHPTVASALVPVLVSLAVTVVAALVPAQAATRVSPVAALRPADAPSVRARPGRVRLTFSLLLTLGGAAVLVASILLARAGTGLDEMLVLLVGILGGAVSFVGLLVGAPLWIPGVAAAVGRPVARISTSARLAAANAVRNPRRTAATSSALVIGVTLVVMMSTGATSARISMAREMDARAPIDLVVETSPGTTLDPRTVDELTALDDVETVVETWTGVLVDRHDNELQVLVLDQADAGVLRDRETGDVLAAGRSIVPDWWEVDDGRLSTATGQEVAVDVEQRDVDSAILTAAAADALDLEPTGTDVLMVRLHDDADAAAVLSQVLDLASQDGVHVESAAAKRQSNEQAIDVVLAVVVGLLGVAVVIALIGVANTLSLSVIERRRESATLRAVGLSRRGLRSMLATEGMLIAGVGALIGSVLGLVYGWAGAAVVFGTLGDVQLTVPWGHLAAVMVVALLAGLAASALPARVAARTPPVAALGVD